MNTPATPATTEDLSACVAACLAALEQSQACANACIRSGDRMLENCALMSLDCAAICQATLNVLLRQSDHHGDFCALCQHICNACGSANSISMLIAAAAPPPAEIANGPVPSTPVNGMRCRVPIEETSK